MDKAETKEDSISLLDLLLILAKNKWLIIITTAISAVVISVLSMLSIVLPSTSPLNFFPNKYKPEVRVLLKTPGEGGGSMSSLLSNNSEIGSLVGLLGGNVGSGFSGIGELSVVLLRSNLIIDKITEKHKFKERYNLTKYVKTEGRKIFKESITVDFDNVSSILNIGFIDTNSDFAADVVNSIVIELEKNIKNIFLKKTITKKNFLEGRIDFQTNEYKKVQNDMVAFQTEHGIINVSAQTEASVSYISGLQTEMYGKELELKNLKESYSFNEIKIELLESEINQLKKLISELKGGFSEFSNDFIPQDLLPELAARYLNLKQDLTLQGAILQMLKEQYEAVKIEESDNSETINILEWAEVPEMKYSPSRGIILIVVIFSTFFITVFISFIKEYYNNLKKDPVENEKLRLLKNSFKLKK